jgi:hypothetical protein
MKIILIPKLAFWSSLCLLLSISYPSSASLVKEEERKVKVTLEKPTFVSTGDIFALRVSLSGIHDGTNNKPKPDKEVEVEVELEHNIEVYLRNKLEFYGGNGRFLQRKVIQVGSNSSTSSVGVEFLIRAIARKQELVHFQVRVREMNQIIGIESPYLTVGRPGIEWLLTNYRLIDFRKNRRMEVELFDKASYPAGLQDDEIYGRSIQLSLNPFRFTLKELEWKYYNQLHYNPEPKDGVDIFDMRLQGLQNKLMQIEIYFLLKERAVRKPLELPSHFKEDVNSTRGDLLRNLEPDIMFLMEFWNEEGGHFSGCSRNVSCREIEATAGALKSLPLMNRWADLVEVNKTVLGMAAKYLHKISSGVKDKVTMEQLLDISIALITFNDCSMKGEKLELTPLINWLIASFDFTHKHSPLLNKFTFVLSKIWHSRAEEFLSKVEQNSKVSGENGRHWDNSVEGTAYALRSYLLQRKEMDSILPIVRWLVEKYYQNGEIHQPNPREVEIHHLNILTVNY